jgi:hypothetical protein
MLRTRVGPTAKLKAATRDAIISDFESAIIAVGANDFDHGMAVVQKAIDWFQKTYHPMRSKQDFALTSSTGLVNPAAKMEYADIAVNRFRQFCAVVLLLVWSLAPAMACTLPNVQMTPDERACCVQMQRNCSGMDMPASHPCCQKQVRTDRAAVIQKCHSPSQWSVLQIVPGTQMAIPVSLLRELHALNVSPPQSPPSAIIILRI